MAWKLHACRARRVELLPPQSRPPRGFVPVAAQAPTGESECDFPGQKQQEVRVRRQAKTGSKRQVEVAEQAVSHHQSAQPTATLGKQEPAKHDQPGIKEAVAEPITDGRCRGPQRCCVETAGATMEADVLERIPDDAGCISAVVNPNAAG